MSEDATTLAWIEVATLDDLWEGEVTDVQVGDELILLVHLAGGEIRAYQGHCPHQRTALADGHLDGQILTCAAHLWQFNLSTGQGVNPRAASSIATESRLRMKPSPWVSLRMVNPIPIVVLRQSRRQAMDKVELQKLVGPVIRSMDQEIIEALLIAIADDNPDAELFYEDHGGYVRIHTPWRCRVTRKSMEAALGRSFRLPELEPALSAFAGRMRSVGDEALEWYLERED